MSFLAFSFHCVCSLYVWMKFPHHGRNFPKLHTSEKECFFPLHIHEINMGSCIFVCDWLNVSTNHNELVLVEPGWQNRISKRACESNILVWTKFYQCTLTYTKRINPKFATESECNHIYVSFSMPMLLSDIWSRSNFWVTMHTSWVLMSVKQLIHWPIYRLNQSLLLQMLASFARSVWFILMIFVAQNGTWNVPGISDCLLGYYQ